ncbi:DNA mismatch repair protein MutT [candidate division MSBL1 archaeon SCGC-AAA261G05]|uniref:DNA mismatch repair protein MutT n=1 Tax=candidate division MSBL1 archaeon SCGC-AAA261G05 TaxID=1698276 RepID=A0A133VAE9_9EURY|nr:DNA mismatch repair protein MutT [candidate division MSBL1 archaeon SCGC-AAA261G05]
MTLEKTPHLTVDVIVQTEEGVVLVKRKNDPFKGKWAIPGGFVKRGETVEQAAYREVKEETGLKIELGGIVGIYSDPKRDPQGHIVTICFNGRKVDGELQPATDAMDVKIFKDIPWNKLAFDHQKILKDAGVE